jgi:hypothetical protein
MFIIGFFELASLGIEIGEPLKGAVGCQAFARNPKGGLGRIFILCSQVAHARALIGGPLPSCRLFEGLGCRRWQGLRRNSLRVMEATAKAD